MTSPRLPIPRASRRATRLACWSALVLALTLAAPTAPALAQNAPNAPRWPARDRSKGITLTLSPQPETRPALEFALLPRAFERNTGNAALKYLAAMSQVPKLESSESDLLSSALNDAPLAELNESEKILSDLRQRFNSPLRTLAEGARMDSVDWDDQIREKGVAALLTSLGSLRQAASALALQIRFDIKRHDWVAAREKLATGYALAHHLGQGETLIESLVGTAIAGLMDNTLEDWVAEPGAPNLYWPLSNLPTPLVDRLKALDFETGLAYFSIPEIKDMKQGHYTAENWLHLLRQINTVGSVGNGNPGLNGQSDNDAAWQIGSLGLGMVLYPQAKEFLKARGMSPDSVDKMPVPEVLGRYFVRSFEETRDDTFKWAALPMPQAYQGMHDAEQAFAKDQQGNLLAKVLLPALSRAILTSARQDRQIAALRIVEAIRAHAAAKGALPARLEDLTLPLPKDPSTGESFQYELRDGKAVLSSPATPANETRGALHIEITLRK